MWGSVSGSSHVDLYGFYTFMHLPMTLRQPAYPLPCMTSTSNNRLPITPFVYYLSWLISFYICSTLRPCLFRAATAPDLLPHLPFMASSLGLALGTTSLVLTSGFPGQLGWILGFFVCLFVLFRFVFFPTALRNIHSHESDSLQLVSFLQIGIDPMESFISNV